MRIHECTLVLFGFFTFIFCEENQASQVDSVGYIYNFVLPQFELSEVDTLGQEVDSTYEGRRFRRVGIQGMICHTVKGTPELPVYEFQMSVPSKSELPSFELISTNYDTIYDCLPIYPKQEKVARGIKREELTFAINKHSYQIHESVEIPIKVSEIRENRGATFVTIRVTPFNYDPIAKTLQILKQSTIKIGLPREVT